MAEEEEEGKNKILRPLEARGQKEQFAHCFSFLTHEICSKNISTLQGRNVTINWKLKITVWQKTL